MNESDKDRSAPVAATLTVGERSIELPLMHGSVGPSVIDIRQLTAHTGVFSYDPGFGATASCQSSITYIDGDSGTLLHRGYPIEQLAAEATYLETAYLLLYGELPSKEEYETFQQSIKTHALLNEQIRDFFRGFRRDAHPMAILCGTVAALSAFYPDIVDLSDRTSRDLACHRLLAKVATIGAWAYKYSKGEAFIYPDNRLSFSENFLKMLFARPNAEYIVNPILARAIDRIFLLHADHEQNASTSTVRLVGSTGSNPFACVAAGIAALWGPAHGGANEAVLSMLESLGTRDNIPDFIQKVKDRKSGVRLMGFGHRVYRNFDPRAKIMEHTYHEVVAELGLAHDPMFDLAAELQRIAVHDPYFIERKLYPNVDFYSGLILKAIGIPKSMFTVLFAIARTSGWISQWREMLDEPHHRIGRPRQLYTGAQKRDFVPFEKR